MVDLLQILLTCLVGILLLWFGYTLFLSADKRQSRKSIGEAFTNVPVKGSKTQTSIPGAPRTCPICSRKLKNGERVNSSAFPSMGGLDRMMHIFGCPYCLSGEGKRICPVCGAQLSIDDYLIARLFDKPTRSHVHVLGCTHCRGPASRHT